MNRLSAWLLCGLLMLPMVALQAAEDDADKPAKAVEVAIKDLPKAVVEAAQKAVPGIVLIEAEKITKGDQVLYELDGKVGDKKYELVITAEGKLVRAGEEKADQDDNKNENGEKAEKDDDDDNEADDDNDKEDAEDDD